MTSSQQESDDALSKIFLFFLRFAVYSDSSFLIMTLLSLYGFIRGVACVPRKRLSAARSLLRYGVNVVEKKVGSSTRGLV